MSNIQESITSITKEHDTRRHLAVIVCMIAAATVLAVFWSLHINGITLSSGDLICGMEEHTHTSDCYAWVPVEDETEDGSELEETETVTQTEPEEGTETETISGTEEIIETETGADTEENTETVTALGTENDTESATESVSTETGTEALTENGSEALTEEETEAAQVGDTKIINGVEYVYTLICGMEEHTHTDECYADEDSEETETEETADASGLTAGVSSLGVTRLGSSGPSAGVSAASVEEEGNSGIAMIAEVNSSSASYLFADTLSLSSAVNALDEEYLVYTIVNGTYYLVKSDGTLVPCTDLSSESDDDEKVSSSSSDGTYYWGRNDDNTDSFKLTSLSSLALEDYYWTLNSTGNSDSSSNGEYTIYNSGSGNYLAPGNGVAETISDLVDTAIWGSSRVNGTSYNLAADKVIEFTITCTEDVNDYAAFSVELYDSGKYLTTSSNKTAWFANSSTSNENISGNSDADSTIVAGTTYTVTVVRTDTYDATETTIESTRYTIIYYDVTNNKEFVTIVATETDLTSDPVDVYVIAQVGTFDISVAYESKVTKVNTITESFDDITTDASDASTIDTDTTTGNQTLTGDFDVTYTFTNSHEWKYDENNRQVDYNFVFGISFSDDDTSTEDTCVYLYASGQARGSGNGSKTSTTVYGTGTYIDDIEFYEEWTNNCKDWGTWLSQMGGSNPSPTCIINAVREDNTITVTTTVVRNGTTLSESVATIYCDYFTNQTATLFLTGTGVCTISSVTLTDNTPDYEVDDYAAYSVVTTDKEGLYLAASGTYGWTGYEGELTSNPNLITASDISTVDWIASTSGMTYYLARVRSYKVYFDATNGGTSCYASMTSEQVLTTTVDESGDCWVTVPTAAFNSGNSANGYSKYTLRGWQDIYSVNTSVNGTSYYNMIDTTTSPTYESIYAYGTDAENYYGEAIQIVGHTVFYADWYVTDEDYNIADGTEDGALDDADDENNSNKLDKYGYGAGGMDTSGFMTTRVFDYNDLFNELSAVILDDTSYDSSLNATSHTEYWGLVGGTTSYSKNFFDTTSLMFIFLNSYGSGSGASLSLMTRSTNYTTETSYNINRSKSYRTAEILETQASTESLITYLFATDNAMNTATSTSDAILGKTYVGEGNYLFQYNEKNGYYYYDSIKNAAAYNSDEDRFYLYDYTVRMTKKTDGSDSVSSADFTPFNYVAKADDAYIYTNAIDYWFGMNTTINFTLPNTIGNTSSKTNQTITGDMVFKFIGDDDLWIYIDGYLVLDIGGIHGEVYGEINFSNGLVTIVNNMEDTFYYIVDNDNNGETVTDGNGDIYIYSIEAEATSQITALTSADPALNYSVASATGLELFIEEDEYGLYQITDYAYDTNSAVVTYSLTGESGYTNITTIGLTTDQVSKITASGSHTFNMYYLERGGSEINLAAMTNISPTYDLTLTKADANDTSTTLDDAVFTVYEMSDISDYTTGNSSYSTLQEYLAGEATEIGIYYTEDAKTTSDNDSNHTVTITDLQPLHTYYIVETEAPSGYPIPSKIIQIYMDSSGNLTITILDEGGNTLEQYVVDSSGTITTNQSSTSGNAFVSSSSGTITNQYVTADGKYYVSLMVLNTYEYSIAHMHLRLQIHCPAG